MELTLEEIKRHFESGDNVYIHIDNMVRNHEGDYEERTIVRRTTIVNICEDGIICSGGYKTDMKKVTFPVSGSLYKNIIRYRNIEKIL